jgi:hypothetical protein
MFLSELGLRNPAFAQKREDFLGIWVGNASGSRIQGLRRRLAVAMLVFRECLDVWSISSEEKMK